MAQTDHFTHSEISLHSLVPQASPPHTNSQHYAGVSAPILSKQISAAKSPPQLQREIPVHLPNPNHPTLLPSPPFKHLSPSPEFDPAVRPFPPAPILLQSMSTFLHSYYLGPPCAKTFANSAPSLAKVLQKSNL